MSRHEALVARALADANVEKKEHDIKDLPLLPQTWHVLVEPYEPDEFSDGGIALPGAVQRANNILSSIAKIMALGPDVHSGRSVSGIELSGMNLKVGLYVYVQPYTGIEHFFKGGYPKLKTIANSNIIDVLRWSPDRFQIYAG